MTGRSAPAIFEALVEHSQDQLVYLDPRFNFVWVNRAYASTCRRAVEDFLGRNHFDLYPHPENQAIFERVRDTGEAAVWREKPFVFPDQPERGVTYWDWTLTPDLDEAGRVRGLVFSLREVTDKVAARQRLQRNEERLRLAQTSAQVGIWDWDLATGEVRFCALLEAIYGVEPGSIRTYEDWRRVVHPDDIDEVERECRRAIAEKRRFDLQYRFFHGSGEVRWLSSRGAAVHDDSGAAVRVLGVNIDVTQQRRLTEELRCAHDRAASLARFAEENPEPVLRLAQDLSLSYANPAAHEALRELGALEIGRRVARELADGAARALAAGGSARQEVRSGGRTFSMTFSASGAEIDVYGHEITEWKQAEAALRESERIAEARAAELQAVLDTVPAAVLITHGRTGDRIDANRFGAELLRLPHGGNASTYATAGERATHFRVMRHGQELQPDEQPIQGAARHGKESRNQELDIVFDDGTVRHLLGNAAPLRDDRGEPRGAVGAFIDITERNQAELRLREANRRKDEFLGMLSHELRNPLAPIRNCLYLLDRVDPHTEQARRSRAVISRQVDHLTRIVDDLLDVTRVARGKVELRRGPLDLAEIVSRTVDDHRSLLEARGLALRHSSPGASVWVDGDPTRLTQVLGNLLQNSAKFTPPGGEVVVSLRALGHAAELEVRDTGIGIEPDLLPQIFEPFVQGERPIARTEGGLGLGLALVKGIADLHGGWVRAESAGRGMGSAFFVRLPLCEPTRAQAAAPAQDRARGGASRWVPAGDDVAPAASMREER